MRRPLHVILDVTSRCNLKCVMCYFAATDRLHFPPAEVPAPEDGNMPIPVYSPVAYASALRREHSGNYINIDIVWPEALFRLGRLC